MQLGQLLLECCFLAAGRLLQTGQLPLPLRGLLLEPRRELPLRLKFLLALPQQFLQRFHSLRFAALLLLRDGGQTCRRLLEILHLRRNLRLVPSQVFLRPGDIGTRLADLGSERGGIRAGRIEAR